MSDSDSDSESLSVGTYRDPSSGGERASTNSENNGSASASSGQVAGSSENYGHAGASNFQDTGVDEIYGSASASSGQVAGSSENYGPAGASNFQDAGSSEIYGSVSASNGQVAGNSENYSSAHDGNGFQHVIGGSGGQIAGADNEMYFSSNSDISGFRSDIVVLDDGPLGEGTFWQELTEEQRDHITEIVEGTFERHDFACEPDYIREIRINLCAFLALRCEQFPVLLESEGDDLIELAHSMHPLRRDLDGGAHLRSKWTHHYPAMTAEDKAIALFQDAEFVRLLTPGGLLPSYSDLVVDNVLSPATAKRLGRFRPHSRVPMSQLARMPAAAPETRSPTMSPGYEAPQLDMSSPGSPLAGAKMSPPTHMGEQSVQRPAGANERAAKEWEEGLKKTEAAKAKELESIAKSQKISSYLNVIDLFATESKTARLLNGLPDDPQVSTDNFFDWLHQVDIPYDAAINELPGKQLTTGEGQQVQVPEYDDRRHGGRKFHKQARITGRIRAEVRDETRNVDFTDRRRARGLSPVPAGPRVAHNQWQPKVQSQQAVENAVTDRHYRASSEPIGNRDLRQLRPFFPNLIPPQAEPLSYKQHPEPSDTDDQRRRKESKARKEEAKSRKSPRDESKVKKSKRSPK